MLTASNRGTGAQVSSDAWQTGRLLGAARSTCCVSVPVASAPVDPEAAANGVGRMQMGPTRPNHVVEAERFPPELGLPTAAGLPGSPSWQQQRTEQAQRGGEKRQHTAGRQRQARK